MTSGAAAAGQTAGGPGRLDVWELTKAVVDFILTLLVILALVIHLPEIVVFPIPRLLGLM